MYAKGRGIVLNEPTVIALNSHTHDVLAMGQEAWHMIGRTPGYIVAEVRRQWPELGRVAALHRVGALDVGETSVLVAVSAPHRAEAFAAARFCIDTLKATVPIWKRETWEGGSDWALCSHPVDQVSQVGDVVVNEVPAS